MVSQALTVLKLSSDRFSGGLGAERPPTVNCCVNQSYDCLAKSSFEVEGLLRANSLDQHVAVYV